MSKEISNYLIAFRKMKKSYSLENYSKRLSKKLGKLQAKKTRTYIQPQVQVSVFTTTQTPNVV